MVPVQRPTAGQKYTQCNNITNATDAGGTTLKASKKTKTNMAKQSANKTRLLYKHFDEEWQRDMLPLTLKIYPLPPGEMSEFNALMETSNLLAISRNIIEEILPEEIIGRIASSFMSDLFVELVIHRWNGMWMHLCDAPDDKYKKELSNEQVRVSK